MAPGASLVCNVEKTRCPVRADWIAISAVSDPPNGTAAITGSSVTYIPESDFFGTDSFSYTLEDSFWYSLFGSFCP